MSHFFNGAIICRVTQHTLSLSLSLTHTHTHITSLSITHYISLLHTHTHTYARTYRDACSRETNSSPSSTDVYHCSKVSWKQLNYYSEIIISKEFEIFVEESMREATYIAVWQYNIYTQTCSQACAHPLNGKTIISKQI